MAALPGALNTSEYTRTQPEGTPLPPGIYKGMITKTEQKATKPGTAEEGLMLVVEFDITCPEEMANRKFWDRFNIMNANPDTVRIATEQLADLGKAAGILVLEDDEQLIGQEVILELMVEPAKPYVDKQGNSQTGKAQNKCKKYWHVDTDIDAQKAAQKGAKAATAPAVAPKAATPNVGAMAAAKPAWGGQKLAAPAAPAAQPAATGAKPSAPWKRSDSRKGVG